ncbi:MAG: hypothetical protein K6E50_07570 [Lachnospiraceae bacterium]|nr:hypothetical protein [Lachnospiraceae bacterium]
MAEVNGISPVAGGASAISVNSSYQPRRIQGAPDAAGKAAETTQKQREESKEASEKRKELQDVIATSRDGDTVQARKEALEQLKEDDEVGRVVSKDSLLAAKEMTPAEQEKAAEEAAEKRAAEREAQEAKAEAEREARQERFSPAAERMEQREEDAEEEEKAQISSFNGYTDAQLKQLYIKGDISKQDYDKEIESRESSKEEQRADEAAFQKESAKGVGKMKENERDAETMRNIESPDSADAPDAMMRAQIMMTLDANSPFQEGSN